MSSRPIALVVLAALAAVAAPVLTAPTSPEAPPASQAAQAPAAVPAAPSLSPEAVIAALRKPENSTGNIADAVEAATGARGWMSSDMKPISAGKIVGRAWTAVMRPVLKSDTREYPNYLLQVLDEAPAGSVLVYVMQDGLEIAAMGNLMATTAKARGLEGTVIDGAVRDVTELRAIGHQVFSRRVSPATSVGRMVSVSKQTPVRCADVMVTPGDYIVVVPQGAAADQVVALLKDYDARESKMVPIIQREKSMLKALEIYGRY
jgi:regulator of RNase E activity RraA